MEERILNYRKYIDKLLSGEISKEENEKTWQDVLEEHLNQVGFFQHERLIHLIVTVTFAIMTIMALAIFLITENIAVVALIVMLLVLLIPYIRHYYILENEVQKMYKQYDQIIRLARQERN